MAYQDIAASGLIVTGTAGEDGGLPVVRFGSDTPIPVPVYVRNLRVTPDGRIAAFKGNDDRAYTVTRSGAVAQMGVAYGDESVALTPSGKLVFVTSRTHYSFNGVLREIPARLRGTSQGIHSAQDDGTIIWGDDRLVPAKFGPLTLIKYTTVGAWTWGTCAEGCGVWNAATQTAYLAIRNESLLWTVRGAVVDGQLVLASSLPNVVVRQSQFQPFTRSIRIPAFKRAGRNIGVYAWGEPGGLNVAEAGDARYPVTAKTVAVFVDVTKPHAPVREAQDLAARHGLPLLAYFDQRPVNPALIPDGAIALLNGYGRPGQSAASTAAEVSRDIDALYVRPWGVAIAAYCGVDGNGQFVRDEQVTVDTAVAVHRLTVDRGGLLQGWFAWERGTPGTLIHDGMTRFASLRECYDRAKAACGDWRVFPKREQPAEPEPEPEPEQPVEPAPTPEPEPEPPAEERTEWVQVGNQRVLVTPTRAREIREAQQAAVDAFKDQLP